VTNAVVLQGGQLCSLPPDSFDFITALDVLEHVPDLSATVLHLGALLRPGGRLVVCGPTENVLYKVGRWLAGFSGDYHVRDIEDIHQAVRRHYPTAPLGTLFPGVPFFRLFEAVRPATSLARTA
jgi:SAM-dependent methyltransferase